MSKSVRRGGAVCGPAPLKETINVIELPVRRSTLDDVAGNTSVPENPEVDDCFEVSLAVARASLANAVKSQRHLEARLEKVCSSLLIAGEQIPTFDQSQLSMLQEAYINASTAHSVASEKAMILHHKVSRLEQTCDRTGSDTDDGWLKAA